MGKAFVYLVILGLACGCSGNLFSSFADTTSDQSLLTDAKLKINNKDYAGALLNFPQMSQNFQKTPAVLEVQASAYAGSGGLDFLTLAYNLQTLGTDTFTQFLMKSYEGGTVTTATALLNAETAMTNISTSFANLTSDENIELAAIEMAHMGTILSRYADTDSNGSVDAGFDPCSTSSIPDATVQELGYAINYALGALDQASADGVSFGSSLATASAACGLMSAGPPPFPSYAFCGVYRGTAFTPSQLTGLRSLLKENTVGLATCAGSILICHC